MKYIIYILLALLLIGSVLAYAERNATAAAKYVYWTLFYGCNGNTVVKDGLIYCENGEKPKINIIKPILIIVGLIVLWRAFK